MNVKEIKKLEKIVKSMDKKQTEDEKEWNDYVNSWGYRYCPVVKVTLKGRKKNTRYQIRNIPKLKEAFKAGQESERKKARRRDKLREHDELLEAKADSEVRWEMK